MPTTGIEITGADKVIRGLKRAGKRGRNALGAALYLEAADIMRASLREVPVDTGRLRSSHYIAPPGRGDFSGPVVELGYGTDYALAVHEQTEVPHGGETKSKYLTGPMNRAMSGYALRVAKRGQNFFEREIGFGGVSFPVRPRIRGKARVKK